jgi:hypothetical protein
MMTNLPEHLKQREQYLGSNVKLTDSRQQPENARHDAVAVDVCTLYQMSVHSHS